MTLESLLFGDPRGFSRANVRGRASGRDGRKSTTGGPIRTGNRGRTTGIFSLSLAFFSSLFFSLRSFSLLRVRRRGGRDHAVANNTVPAFGSVWEAELTDKIKLFQKPPWFSLSSRRVRLFLSRHSFSSSRARGPTSSFSTLDSLSTGRRVRLSPSSYSLPLAPSLILSFFLSLYFANAISRGLSHRSADRHVLSLPRILWFAVSLYRNSLPPVISLPLPLSHPPLIPTAARGGCASPLDQRPPGFSPFHLGQSCSLLL